MKKRTSIVPANAQVPAAIVLAVAFAIVLFWSFMPRTSDEEPPSAPEDIAADIDSEGSLEALKSVLDDVQADAVETVAQANAPPVLAGDPFCRVDPASTAARPADGDVAEDAAGPGDAAELEPLEPGQDVFEQAVAVSSREAALATFRLSGVCVLGDRAIAIINGRYVRAGDEFEGFIVKEVKEREVVRKDESGEETIGVSAPLWLFDEEGVYEIIVERGEPEL